MKGWVTKKFYKANESIGKKSRQWAALTLRSIDGIFYRVADDPLSQEIKRAYHPLPQRYCHRLRA